MKKIILAFATLFAFAASVSAQNKPSTYGMSCGVIDDSLSVAVWCYWDQTNDGQNYALLSQSCTIFVIDDIEEVPYKRSGDTVFLLEQHDPIRFVYNLPLEQFRAADGVINLHREDNWYPHRNDEVEYVYITMYEDDYHVILNGDLLGVDVERTDEGFFGILKKADGLHLILLPKK